ncbi:MAG: cupin domain-containing protein [Hydrogenovibrio sp.]|uniref:cupin domain-containing protein n=1 Tax=Hydrogenovibrio sp. TaxID=2065821 RepID=UPI00287011B6|nr:cupin domain-containing protein [Hydrogenovibrio sp.]MDR9500139.1 cupin domain-containing protein [Hydrogenovibrio sp.]
MPEEQSYALNLDLSQKVVVDTEKMGWEGSRADNVLRKPLERESQESGRATSIVQFMPGASFPAHRHDMGEEIFVLQGEFIDEHGRYPAGTWIRSPHKSLHDPWVEQETLIWVKTGHS